LTWPLSTACVRALLSVCLGICFVVASSRALAEDAARVTATNTLDLQYRTDNANGSDRDDDYALLINRLNLNASSGSLTALLRADTFYFNPLRNDRFDLSNHQDDLILERVMIRHEGRRWSFTGGDFYRFLGRGIALSLRKVDEAAVDITLRGGQVEYKDKHHNASVFGGYANTTNIDAVSLQTLPDKRDILAGAHYETSALSGTRLGAHGVYSRPEEVILDQRKQSATGGLFVDLPSIVDWLSWYTEADVQRREVLGQSQTGWAAYTTADISATDDLGFTVEGLYLKAFEQQGSLNEALGNRFAYAQPPTLERFDQEVGSNRDVLGARLRAEYMIPDTDLLIYVNGAYRINDQGDPAVNDALHLFAGTQQTFQAGKTRLFLSGGYRNERKGAPNPETFRTMVHGEVDYLQWLVGGLSVHLQVIHQQRTQEAVEFARGSTLLGLEWSRTGSLTFEFGYDTQDPSEDVRNYFYAGIFVWDITPDIQMRLIGGTQRGGIRCIAGVCRNFPAFSGVQSLMIARF
jgi:hypothetical protein